MTVRIWTRAAMMIVALCASLMMPSATRAEDFPFNAFRPSTLAAFQAKMQSALEAHRGAAETPTGEAPVWRDAETNIQRARIRITYTGEHRPLSAPFAALLAGSNGALGSPEFLRLFQNEYAFREFGETYWFAVEAPLEPAMKEELRPGATVDVYVVLAGSIDDGETAQPAALLEEFEADPTGVSGARAADSQTELYEPATLSEFQRKQQIEIEAEPPPEARAAIEKFFREHPELKNDPNATRYNLDNRVRRARVQAVFTGRNRPAPSDTLDLLAAIASFYLSDPQHIQTIFQTEFEFREGDETFWLPAVRWLDPAIAQELRPGSRAVLFVRRVGSISKPAGVRSVAVVERFAPL